MFRYVLQDEVVVTWFMANGADPNAGYENEQIQADGLVSQ
jgi:hypothetical protein